MLLPPALAQSLWKGCSVIVRKLAAWLVGCALVVAGAVGGAAPAAAAPAVGFWIPSEWFTVATGAASAVRAYLNGAGGTVSNAPALDLESTWWGTGPEKVSVRVVGVTAANLPKLQYAVTNEGGQWPADGEPWGKYNATTSGNLTCQDNYSQAIGGWTSEGAPNISSPCSVHGGVKSVWFHRSGFTDTTRTWQWWTWYAGVEALRTDVTCRNLSTGADTVVTESSPSGVAPMPVCPAGTVAVRAQIWQGSVLLQDASMTSTALDKFGAYIGDPVGWDWKWGSTAGDCYISQSSDPTMVIQLSVSACSEGADQGIGQAQEQPDCGADLVCSMVRLVGDTISGLMRGLSTTVNRILDVIRDGFNGVKTGLQSILEKLIEFKEQEAADTGGGPGEGETAGPCTEATCGSKDPGIGGPPDGPGAGWDDLGSKFDPLMDALDDLGHAFNPPATGDCRGPGIPLTVGRPPVYPLDACEQPMAGVASLAKIACGVLLCLGAFMAIVRVVLSSIGMTVDVGQGS